MSAFLIVIYIVCAVYMLLNFKYDIQMLQQNSYRLERYWRWLKPNIASSWRLVDVVLLFLLCSTLLTPMLNALIIAFVALAKTFLIFKRKYKKPLVFTKRVWRIYCVSAAIALIVYVSVAICAFGKPHFFFQYSGSVTTLAVFLLLAVFSWIPVCLAVIILTPVEKCINRKFYKDAERILRSMPDLTVIGVTGSYGKTSTKHYLNRILSEHYDVLMTPGSYNTTMGVIRTVREMMKPYNKIFICEMGAKQKNDVKEICDLVKPQIGIVTAVGPMHLESFKSIENVQATKFELVDSLPSNGLAVINNDFEYCANRQVHNVKTERYGVGNTPGCSYRAIDVKYYPSGTQFTIIGPDNFSIQLSTQLVGECNISNLVAAVIVALHLNVPVEKIKYAVSRIEQVEHRLNVKQTPGGVTIIDDAFNSNPAGSKMAVEVLAHFTDGKRIIVTPGMIELGDKQFELNRNLGIIIGKNVDVAIIVGEYNRKSLIEGVEATDFNRANLYQVASFNEAQKLLSTILAKGDTVLYENDLPDTFK
ncbi:MAG: UDP-N-acetylmuramoyl-tripeptide--D-alanyl-D-alanine ligase [Prevotella sp.]|nr:UDP-N-acetylmuramoyl-tripeptide--D-alanyl-D-alanine ligase [Bacteroides sp.]MCM1365636.1 UDP-N-acetylmuramoyl-tripeptide--D-alanyl-D-alanine ligase [Prevotella sp.]